MSDRPGTVSKILWHFTGGPVWSEKKNKQGKRPKAIEDSFRALQSILFSRELRLGNYHEIIRAVIPEKTMINPDTREYEIRKNFPMQFESSPVCCVADIPIQHLGYHSKRYGQIAVGFYRDSIIKGGFNPVTYTLEDSSLSNSIVEGYLSLDFTDPLLPLQSFNGLVKEFLGEMKGSDVVEGIKNVEEGFSHLSKGHRSVRFSYREMLAYIKTFDPSEFDSIYCEREWRSTNNFLFDIEDVAMIVLPKKSNKKNYYKKFLDNSLLPRSIPVVCWEDLVDH